MPNLALASEQVRKNFRLQISADLRHIFDQLVKMIENPVQDLPWYHRFGTLVSAIRNASDRSIPMIALEEALGPCSSVLAKSCRFVKEYPEDKDLRSLYKTGTNWTLLTLAFSIKKKRDRHRILREAVDNEWSPRELHAQIHLRYPTGRRSMGGRDRTVIRGLDTAGQVKEMRRLTEEWMFFCDHSFVNVSEADIRNIVRENSNEFAYVESLSTRLREVSRTIRVMQDLLKRVLSRNPPVKPMSGKRKAP